MLDSDAHVIVQRELVTAEHVGPGEAIRLHAALAPVAYGLAQAATRVDRALQAHRREKRTQEELGIRVAAQVEQRNPISGLLLRLLQRVVFQQVGQPHLAIVYPRAEWHVLRDIHTRWLLRPPTNLTPVGKISAGFPRCPHQEEREEREGRPAGHYVCLSRKYARQQRR